MTCPSCGAPLTVVRGLINLRCEYCKGIVYTGPDADGVNYLGEDQSAPCPVCAIPLWDANLGGVTIRACKQCKGMLVAMGAFASLLDQVRTDQKGPDIPVTDDSSSLNRKLDCPLCHHAMDTHFYYGGGHVVIEDCERCEMNWLDGGALMLIAHAPHEAKNF